ncbi:MAG: SPFH domain-containing protein [Planctomycetia bacterium]|nr:SPFH domain-containing protein [Planctomycetia bacterium]
MPDAPPALDPAQQSLAEALRVSFTILKLAMLALLVAYAFSGTFSVGSNEVALRLRFGDYVGDPGNRVLERGTYLAAPFPIEQIVKVDTRPVTLVLDKEFWFETTAQESGLTRGQLQARKAMPLHPLRDGSLITGDSNIAHAKWTLTWRVSDPVAFLTNVGSKQLATDIVRLVAQQGIVQAIAQLAADDLLRGIVNRELAVGLMQERLDGMRTGLVIDQLVLDKVSAPMRVAGSFDAVTSAESDRASRIVAAQQERSRILGETAGEASGGLMGLLTAYEQAVERGDKEAALRIQLAIDTALADLRVGDTAIGGEVARVINTAKTYRTQIVERVASEAQAFEQLLPQYDRNPRLVLSKLWEDAREAILTGDVETFYTVPGQLELQLNRDPELQKQRQKEQMRAKKRQQKEAHSNR